MSPKDAAVDRKLKPQAPTHHIPAEPAVTQGLPGEPDCLQA